MVDPDTMSVVELYDVVIKSILNVLLEPIILVKH